MKCLCENTKLAHINNNIYKDNYDEIPSDFDRHHRLCGQIKYVLYTKKH